MSRLGFGSMGLRGPKTWGVRVASEQTAEEILNQVLDSGINLIDTSPDYGVAEQRIGKFISHRRDEFLLATKCGCVYRQDGDCLSLDHQWTAEVIKGNLEASLRRLRTDVIDVMQFHGGTAKELTDGGLIDLLQTWKKQGKIRSIGISSKLPNVMDLLELGCFDTVQIPFSCLEADHLPIIVHAAKNRIGVIVRGGIGQGGPQAEIQRQGKNENWKKLNLSEFVGEQNSGYYQNPSDLILHWTLDFPLVQTAIVGTANPDHLRQNVKVEKMDPMPAKTFNEILDRVAKLFHLEPEVVEAVRK